MFSAASSSTFNWNGLNSYFSHVKLLKLVATNLQGQCRILLDSLVLPLTIIGWLLHFLPSLLYSFKKEEVERTSALGKQNFLRKPIADLCCQFGESEW